MHKVNDRRYLHHAKVSRKRVEFTMQGQRAHWHDSTKLIQIHEFGNVEKRHSTGWIANDCLEFAKASKQSCKKYLLVRKIKIGSNKVADVRTIIIKKMKQI